MRKTNLNISRWIVHHSRITRSVFFLFSLVYSSANAQPITGPYSGQHSLHVEVTLGILVLALTATIIFVFLLAMFLNRWTDSSAATSAVYPYHRNAGHHGLDPSVIETFPVLMYSAVKEIKIGGESLECAVCLSEFEDDEMLRSLPKCNHVFHPACIDMWLTSHVTCPVCRANLTTESAYISKDSNQQPTAVAPNQENSAAQFNQTRDEIAITIEGEQNRDSRMAVVPSGSRESNRPPKSGISVKLPRSHSTGHSLCPRGGEYTERHTLRLPEELRRQLMTSAKLNRTRSFTVFSAREWSCRRGYRNGGGGGGDSNRGRQIGIGVSDGWYFR